MADPANSPRDRPLLGGGERLAREAQPARAPAEKYHPQSIEEAMGRLGPAARDIRQRTQSMPAKLRGERIILEATLLPNYLAASYHPSQLRDDADLVAIGTRNATGTLRTARQEKPDQPTKTLLLAATDRSLRRLEELPYCSGHAGWGEGTERPDQAAGHRAARRAPHPARPP